MAGHCLNEFWPVGFCELLHTAEACPAAYVADIGLSVVLGWWSPAPDDVGDAAEVVLVAVRSEQAERSPKAPRHRGKLAEGGRSPPLSQERGSLGDFAFPEYLPAPNVQRVVVTDT